MSPACRAARLLRAGLIIATATWVQAAAQDKPRPRPKPLPEPSDRSSASNSLSDQNSLGVQAGAPVPTAARPLVAAPPPLVLRSAVHSHYGFPATIARSTAGQCRAQCSVDRNNCANGQGDTSGCDPGWTRCLSTCDGLSYSRGP